MYYQLLMSHTDNLTINSSGFLYVFTISYLDCFIEEWHIMTTANTAL